MISRQRRGFTILELTTAMVVIITLAALIFPKVTPVKKKAYLDAMKNDLHNLLQQQELYVTKNASYAAGIDDPQLHYTTSDKVSVDLTLIDPQSWLATAQYITNESNTCAVAMGQFVPPGYTSGKIECD